MQTLLQVIAVEEIERKGLGYRITSNSVEMHFAFFFFFFDAMWLNQKKITKIYVTMSDSGEMKDSRKLTVRFFFFWHLSCKSLSMNFLCNENKVPVTTDYTPFAASIHSLFFCSLSNARYPFFPLSR